MKNVHMCEFSQKSRQVRDGLKLQFISIFFLFKVFENEKKAPYFHFNTTKI